MKCSYIRTTGELESAFIEGYKTCERNLSHKVADCKNQE